MRNIFTSESVTEGHPDKLCDYISDSILDKCLEQDKNSRVACETVVGKGQVFVTGEITTKANIDIEQIVRDAIKEIGYDNEKTDIDYKTCKIIVNISNQSKDIAIGVDRKDELTGAGDQGIMFGYATDETENYMPMPIYLAHKLSKRLSEVRRNRQLPYLRPDGKTQVSVEYEDDKPVRIDTIVVSAQHTDNVSIEKLRKDILENVIKKEIPEQLMDNKTKYFINPTGRFVIGGPLGDSGLTGRKIIVDTYGGMARHGGGAFSGKDPTKVDRSASYMARFVAKNIVANGLAKKCEIQLSYAIGIAYPISIFINTFGTGVKTDEELLEIIKENFKFTPDDIIKKFDLKRPIYRQTTNYGHFGKENLPWEQIIKIKSHK